jgi:hypothetical protein
MPGPPLGLTLSCRVTVFLFLVFSVPALFAASWKGTVRDKAGHGVGDAIVSMQATATVRSYTAKTAASGEFLFADMDPLSYKVSIKVNDKTWDAP